MDVEPSGKSKREPETIKARQSFGRDSSSSYKSKRLEEMATKGQFEPYAYVPGW
jgi:hypothetical protein